MRGMNLFGRSKSPAFQSVRVRFYVSSDIGTLDLEAVGHEPGVTPHDVVDNTKGYVLEQLHRVVMQRGGTPGRWWAEDDDGNVLDSGDDYQPPRRPQMWS